MKLMLGFSPFLIIAAIAFIFAYFEGENRKRKRGEWRIVTDGIYDYTVYGEYDYVRRHRTGAMVHTSHTTHHVMTVTAVYFKDGKTCVLKGRHDLLFPTGTVIQVSENGLGERKIEKVG